MPERLSISSCKFCGAEFPGADGHGQAISCERTHLHSKEMVLGHIEMARNVEFCYEPGQPWPTFIRIRCKPEKGRDLGTRTYQLVDTVRRRGLIPSGAAAQLEELKPPTTPPHHDPRQNSEG